MGKIEVEKLPDGCYGHFIFGYKGCPYAIVTPDINNPKVTCSFDKTKENRIFFVGERPKECPLVLKQSNIHKSK